MKTKRTLTIAAGLVALAALTTLGLFRGLRIAKAQDEIGPPLHLRNSPDRNSIPYGMVGLAPGQTIRLNVVNIDDAICPCQRAVLTFLDAEGNTLKNSKGSTIQKLVELEPGRAVALDLDYDELPAGPIRRQLRASVRFVPPGSDAESGGFERTQPVHDHYVTTVEVFDNSNGRTDFAIYASGGYQRNQPAP